MELRRSTRRVHSGIMPKGFSHFYKFIYRVAGTATYSESFTTFFWGKLPILIEVLKGLVMVVLGLEDVGLSSRGNCIVKRN